MFKMSVFLSVNKEHAVLCGLGVRWVVPCSILCTRAVRLAMPARCAQASSILLTTQCRRTPGLTAPPPGT
jgi:hypothetical protein